MSPRSGPKALSPEQPSKAVSESRKPAPILVLRIDARPIETGIIALASPVFKGK